MAALVSVAAGMILVAIDILQNKEYWRDRLYERLPEDEGMSIEEIAARTQMIVEHLEICPRCNSGYEFGPQELWIPGRMILDKDGHRIFEEAAPGEKAHGMLLPSRPKPPTDFPMPGRFSAN